MSRHSFDPAVAEKVGINAAVIYQNLTFWCEKNAANERNIHDGKAWTYNSMKAFEKLFPYLTAKQIRTALQKLEDVGLIESGCFNENLYDRTKWYCLTGPAHLPSKANRNDQKGEPIPDSKPVLKPVDKPDSGPVDLFKGNLPKEKPDKTREKEQTPTEILVPILGEELATGWLDHRKSLKKPMTAQAAKMLASKLRDMRDPKAAVENAIISGWQSVYEREQRQPDRQVRPDPTDMPNFARRLANLRSAV